MRPGQAWVFLEVGLGVVFVITMFCLCRYFDTKKIRRQRRREKAADESCYQQQLAAQRERAMSIRKESLMREECETRHPLAAHDEEIEEEDKKEDKEDKKEDKKEEDKKEEDKKEEDKKEEVKKSASNSPAVSAKKEPPASPKPAEKQ